MFGQFETVRPAWANNPRSRKTLKLRTLVIATIVLFFIPLSACGQQRTTPRITGKSDNYPVPENGTLGQSKVPKLTIVRPAMDALFVGPAVIEIEARAIDRDGAIKEVRFLDNGELIGNGSSQDGETYLITARNIPFGPHSITAVAVERDGQTTTSNAANVFVNGNANVVIKDPAANSLLEPGKDIVILANATDPSGITKVQFFFSTQLIGDGRLTATDEYSVTIPKAWRAAYKIEAVVTDARGIKTISSPMRFVVSKKPTISIQSPNDDYRAVQGVDVAITVVANQPEGDVQKVDFFADDKLLGSAPDNGTGKFYFTWRNIPIGTHCLTAEGTDELGVTGKSNPVTVVVSTKRDK